MQDFPSHEGGDVHGHLHRTGDLGTQFVGHFSEHFILLLFSCPPKCNTFLGMFFKLPTPPLRRFVHL